MPLLDVKELSTTFTTDDGPLAAVDRVSFSVERGRVLGIVGESGCGKSVTNLSQMGLHGSSAKVTGEAIFDGKDLLEMDDDDLRRLRGNEIAMIFQDPMTSLNPVYRIGWQLEEAVSLHGGTRSGARLRALEMLRAVGIPAPEERLQAYPHELSGGMRQRVMIAMALINNPALLIADEPTTALDVTTQAQILELIRNLRSDFDSAIIFVTLDLGVVAELCDEVLVMYAGRVIEQGSVVDIFERPQHPYTWGLLDSLPGRSRGASRLASIPGSPPSLLDPPLGCRFAPRCRFAFARCKVEPPPVLRPAGASGQLAACHLDQGARDSRGETISAGGAVG